MSYTIPKITYSVYDLNSSLFIDVIKNILEVEFNNQITVHGNTFLPVAIKTDEYLLNPISDTDINPSFVSIIKAKMTNKEGIYHEQQNNSNSYVIGILADGLENLRKIGDAIYEILNDMDIKNYVFLYKNANGEQIISDSGKYFINSLSTEFEVSKTINDKNIIYGNLVLNAEISESAKFNTHAEINNATTDFKFGENEINVTQTTTY